MIRRVRQILAVASATLRAGASLPVASCQWHHDDSGMSGMMILQIRRRALEGAQQVRIAGQGVEGLAGV
jgi:hypothetical protein